MEEHRILIRLIVEADDKDTAEVIVADQLNAWLNKSEHLRDWEVLRNIRR